MKEQKFLDAYWLFGFGNKKEDPYHCDYYTGDYEDTWEMAYVACWGIKRGVYDDYTYDCEY